MKTRLLVILLAVLVAADIGLSLWLKFGDTRKGDNEMALTIPVVLSGTYAQRIAYDTSTLLWRTYWYQTDEAKDGGTTYAVGYYLWSPLGSNAWGYEGTSVTEMPVSSPGLSVWNGDVQVRHEDYAQILLVSGDGSTDYGTSLIYYAHDNRVRKLRWSHGTTADSAATFVISRYDDDGVFINSPFQIIRATGAAYFSGSLIALADFGVYEAVYFFGDISPTQITADQNNYNPTSLSTASTLRLSSDLSRNITGLAGGVDGRILIIHNVGAQSIVLVDESASSDAANRFALKANITMTADSTVMLRYDGTSARWRVISSY